VSGTPAAFLPSYTDVIHQGHHCTCVDLSGVGLAKVSLKRMFEIKPIWRLTVGRRRNGRQTMK